MRDVALVQTPNVGNNSGGSSISVSWGQNTASPNLLIAALGMNSTSVGVTAPSGWTLAVTSSNTGNYCTRIYYIEGAAQRSGAETFSFTGSVAASLILAEYSDVVDTGALDKTAFATGGPVTSTGSSGTTATTSQAYEMCVSAIGFAVVTGTPFTPATFTRRGQTTSATYASSLALCDLRTTSTGAYGHTITCNMMGNYAGAIATFKEAAFKASKEKAK